MKIFNKAGWAFTFAIAIRIMPKAMLITLTLSIDRIACAEYKAFRLI